MSQFFLFVFCLLVTHLKLAYQSQHQVDGSMGLKRAVLVNGTVQVSYGNFAADKFYRLQVSVGLSTTVMSYRECAMSCVKTPPCVSFNVASLSDEDGKFRCELLNADKYNNFNQLISSPEYHHFSVKTACSSYPCKNNGKCVPNYGNNQYHCECTPGYEGSHCETVSLCDVNNSYRLQCGWPGIQSERCQARGCCWDNYESDASISCFSRLDKTCENEDPAGRQGCGWGGITREECTTTRGCCWDSSVPGVPWCFYGPDYPISRCTAVQPSERTDCGYGGITKKACVKDRGCCWDSSVGGAPWCFYPEDPA